MFKIRVNYIVNLQKLFIMAAHSFKTTFDLTLTPKQFVFEDTSGVTNTTGCFEITSPSGVIIYQNTDYTSGGCDIDTSLSVNSQQLIQLPTILGIVEAGNYTIKYSTSADGGTTKETKTNVVAFNYASPEICILQTADCISPLFISKDITEYDKAGATVVIERNHSLYFPNGTAGQGSPITTNGATISTNTFYQGDQTSEITSELTYTFVSGSNGVYIHDEISGDKTFTVNCTDICNLLCCIKTLEQMVCAASGTNKADLTIKFNTVMALVGLIQLSINCGQGDKVSGYIEQIKKITHCNECKCKDEEPTQIVGIGSILNNVVVEGNSPIVVTSVVVGNLTTYTVSLSQAFIDLVNQNSSDIADLQTNVADLLNYINLLYATTITSENESIIVQNTNIPPAFPSYNLTTKIKHQYIHTDTTFNALATTNQKIDGLLATIGALESGTYLCIFEADAIQPSGAYNFEISYSFNINDGTISPEPNKGQFLSASPNASSVKMYRQEVVFLYENDTVEVVVSSDKVFNIDRRSLTLIRLF